MAPRTPHLDPKALRRGPGDQKREFGRDGISGLVTSDRALRAREVSRPDGADLAAVQDVLGSLLARVDGRRR